MQKNLLSLRSYTLIYKKKFCLLQQRRTQLFRSWDCDRNYSRLPFPRVPQTTCFSPSKSLEKFQSFKKTLQKKKFCNMSKIIEGYEKQIEVEYLNDIKLSKWVSQNTGMTVLLADVEGTYSNDDCFVHIFQDLL